jgi:hypothetical protein
MHETDRMLQAYVDAALRDRKLKQTSSQVTLLIGSALVSGTLISYQEFGNYDESNRIYDTEGYVHLTDVRIQIGGATLAIRGIQNGNHWRGRLSAVAGWFPGGILN